MLSATVWITAAIHITPIGEARELLVVNYGNNKDPLCVMIFRLQVLGERQEALTCLKSNHIHRPNSLRQLH